MLRRKWVGPYVLVRFPQNQPVTQQRTHVCALSGWRLCLWLYFNKDSNLYGRLKKSLVSLLLGLNFFFFSPKKNGALKIRPALFFGNVKTSGKAREVKRCLFFSFFFLAVPPPAGQLVDSGWVFSFSEKTLWRQHEGWFLNWAFFSQGWSKTFNWAFVAVMCEEVVFKLIWL